MSSPSLQNLRAQLRSGRELQPPPPPTAPLSAFPRPPIKLCTAWVLAHLCCNSISLLMNEWQITFKKKKKVPRPREKQGNNPFFFFFFEKIRCSLSLSLFIYFTRDLGFQARASKHKKKKIQIDIHIVLTKYQPRYIHKIINS